MKFQMTLLVFRHGTLQSEHDILVEFPDAIAAISAVAQLGAANSLLCHHPAVQALFKDLPPNALARLHEMMNPGALLLIKNVQEYREKIPETLQKDPEILFRVVASSPERKVPPEGTIRIHRGTGH